MSLVEVMVSMLLIVMIGLGVAGGIDGAQTISGLNKSRSIASGLAQRDQDRMRALQPQDLPFEEASRSETEGGADYTVESHAEWVTDSSGSAGQACDDGSGTDYVKITSAITWPSMASIPPVTAESLVAVTARSYKDRGNLAVQINKADLGPVPNEAVSLTGAAAGSDQTNVTGCAFFAFFAAGNYDISFSRPGYVDPAGNNTVTAPASVIAGSTTTKQFHYDQAGSISATFDTRRAGRVAGTFVFGPAKAGNLRLKNADPLAPSTPFPTYGNGSLQSTISTPMTLFPFVSPYGVYGGACDDADPQNQGVSPASVVVPRGATGNVVVRMPALNIKVTDSSGIPEANRKVRIYPWSGVCPVAATQFTTASSTADDTPAGALPEPGMPFGDSYLVCAERDYATGKKGANETYRAYVLVPNTDPDGSPVTEVRVTTSSPYYDAKGTC